MSKQCSKEIDSAPAPRYDYTFRITVVGDERVGKTRLINCFTLANEPIESTMGVNFKTRVLELDVRGALKSVCLFLWDTSGQPRYDSITSSYYHGSSALIVVFSLASRKSWLSVPRRLDEIAQHANDFAPRILVATFSDTPFRAVSQTEIDAALRAQPQLHFFELASQSLDDATALFERIAHVCLET